MIKGLLFDIRRYAVHDGPGIRTTLFFKGCLMHCRWCHNPEGIRPVVEIIKRQRMVNGKKKVVEEKAGRWMTTAEVLDIVEKDRLFYEESGGGVSFSGGEPLMQAAFLLDMLALCCRKGIHTAVDTSGYASAKDFKAVAAKTDLLLFDLKTTNSNKHQLYTGVGLALVLQNLLSLPVNGPEVIIRIPVIPGFNDEQRQMEDFVNVIDQLRAPVVRVDLLPYHRFGRQKYTALGMEPPETLPAIAPEAMNRFMEIFKKAGFRVKKGG